MISQMTATSARHRNGCARSFSDFQFSCFERLDKSRTPSRRRWSSFIALDPQPAFDRGFYFTDDTCIKFSGGFPDKFSELHGLNALDVDVALLPQPRDAGQCNLVRCVLKLCGDQNHAGERQSGVGLGCQYERITRFANDAQINERNFARLGNSLKTHRPGHCGGQQGSEPRLPGYWPGPGTGLPGV